MKKFKLLGLIAFAIVLSLNVNAFLENNEWQTGVQDAHALSYVTPEPVPTRVQRISFDAEPVIFPCPPEAPQNFFQGCRLDPGNVCPRTSCWE